MSLFCSRCSAAMEYHAAKGRVVCPRCTGASSGSTPKSSSKGAARPKAAARSTEPLTDAQKAIKAAHAPAKRKERFEGGGGFLVPEEIPESVIQENIMRLLGDSGYLVVRLNSGAAKMSGGGYLRAYRILGMPEKHASAGMPDVLAFRGARALMIEVKDRLGKLRDSQVRFIEHAQKFGVKVHVCRSWQEAENLVSEISQREANKPTRARWLALLAIERIARRLLGERELDELVELELTPPASVEVSLEAPPMEPVLRKKTRASIAPK